MFSFTNIDDPAFSEEKAAKYKTVDMKQLVGLAQVRGLIAEAEVAEFPKWEAERQRPILAQTTKETVTAF